MIVVDSREKRPLPIGGRTTTGTLKFGDYTVEGLRHWTAVEYKSGTDWAGCCYTVKSRERLYKQLCRLRDNVRHPLLVVQEPPSEAVLQRYMRSSRTRRRGELYDYAYHYSTIVPIQIAATPKHAARLVEAWLGALRCKNCGDMGVVCKCGMKQEI